MTSKSEPVSFRLPPTTKMAMEEIARKDARSLSSLLEKMCNELIERERAKDRPIEQASTAKP